MITYLSNARFSYSHLRHLPKADFYVLNLLRYMSSSYNGVVTALWICIITCMVRRQTAEEREAERQAANRLMMSLQAEVVSKSIYDQTRDPLCISNASLHALQTLQPWATESAAAAHAAAAAAASHHQSGVDRPSFLDHHILCPRPFAEKDI
ncbi:t-cell leukemia homeobox protein 3 [Trichonephila clavata]|uniref:T-cell leukemia homeobox protein 3 n=1 Tax=Trichonephila clavata TaxID=2740835 RepID=A0A8X6HXF4_TRICU|nr:t-cell leukemia homeobox protein 3 [Trichonephila clavata]